MMNHFKVLFKLSILLAIAVMMVQFYVPVTAAPQKEIQRMPSSDKIPDELEAVLDGLQSDQKISVIITLQDQADLSQIPGSTRASRLTGIIRALQAMAESSQASVRMFLSQKQGAGQVSHMTPLWIMNGLSVTANSAVIQELAARPDVRSITPDEIDVVPVGMEAYLTPQMNLTRIRVPQVWDSGWFGQESSSPAWIPELTSPIPSCHPVGAGETTAGSIHTVNMAVLWISTGTARRPWGLWWDRMPPARVSGLHLSRSGLQSKYSTTPDQRPPRPFTLVTSGCWILIIIRPPMMHRMP